MEDKKYTHILQKKGILKTFSVAKIVKREDIKELEELIRNIASDETEYNQILKEEIAKLSNMHDENNPIPGIIYSGHSSAKRDVLFNLAEKISENLKKKKFEKSELALLISSVISKLDLNPEDFAKLNKELSEELGEDYENTDEDDENTDEDEDYEE